LKNYSLVQEKSSVFKRMLAYSIKFSSSKNGIHVLPEKKKGNKKKNKGKQKEKKSAQMGLARVVSAASKFPVQLAVFNK
jgi:hypothetical protein